MINSANSNESGPESRLAASQALQFELSKLFDERPELIEASIEPDEGSMMEVMTRISPTTSNKWVMIRENGRVIQIVKTCPGEFGQPEGDQVVFYFEEDGLTSVDTLCELPVTPFEQTSLLAEIQSAAPYLLDT